MKGSRSASAGDAVAEQTQTDLTTAYNEAAGRTVTANLTGQDLGGINTVGFLKSMKVGNEIDGVGMNSGNLGRTNDGGAKPKHTGCV